MPQLDDPTVTATAALQARLDALERASRDTDTRVSLRDYMEALIRELESKTQVRYVEVEKAVKIAETSTAERLKHHNGILDMMREQSTDFPRKVELNSINKRLDDVSSRVYWLMGVSAAAGTAAGVAAAQVFS